ncbi:MAG: primosomal protein N' [Candidatus Omnitrophica bacterium]|nr:primosomal protein N' [Candidatus Omnitrophota bacterium]
MNYAEVALNLPINKTFHYNIPEAASQYIAIGKRVWVPFGKRRIIGYVVDIGDKSPMRNLRDIEKVIDDTPIISSDLMRLAKWLSAYYCTSLGSALAAIVPAPLKSGKTSVKARKTVTAEEKYASTTSLKLTGEQERAFREIKKSIEKEEFKVFLLHGITSSGKTEIYLQCIADILAKGKNAIVLIPEISLTPQTVERFKARFGDKVAVFHSQMRGGKRFEEWKAIKDGTARIVVGARSAIFSPMENIGIIVVDEEHETSYKQEDTPRYHARETAIERAKISRCPVILGTATPSLESYYKAQKGEYRLLKLTMRIDDRPLPRATIIDMKKEIEKRRKVAIISSYLRQKIEEAVKDKKQVMLFLNRRGFATYINCRNCGAALKCKKCDSVLVYHSSKRELVCHYCGRETDVPKICPECQSAYLNFSGKGTEKIESEMHRLFPMARIDRMDTDVTRKIGSHNSILRKVKDGSTDVLIGTQMIAKGHDFPQVTLVGVISADVTINLPDFRSSERTFDLLTQVGGRAGRGKDAGEVVIQTYAPSHYAISDAAKHDYEAFYKREIEYRKELDLPPFCNMIKVTLRSTGEIVAKEAAAGLADYLKNKFMEDKITVMGPAPGIMPKIRGRYIWNIILKTKTPLETSSKLRSLLEEFGWIKRSVIGVDVDPISM